MTTMMMEEEEEDRGADVLESADLPRSDWLTDALLTLVIQYVDRSMEQMLS